MSCLLAEAYPWIDAIYLFGSRARGDARAGSDVDLAVLPAEGAAPEDRVAAEAELARFVEEHLRLPVDVVLLRRELSPALLFDIFRVETILFARDWEQAHLLACRARAEYRDLLPRRVRALARLRREVEERADALNRPGAGAAPAPE
jgi:predicted nucleotidyltransferase